jgi:hypothetical protein
MNAHPLRRWLPIAALCLAAAAPPAAASDCAVLLDNTGTILIVTDRGTLSHFFCHGIPVLTESIDKPGPEDDEGAVALSYGEGFSVVASREEEKPGVVARAEGNSSHPTEGVVPVAPCVVKALKGRDPVLATPPDVYPPVYLVPTNSEVVVETRTESANGQLGFRSYFTFVGGTAHVNLHVHITNLSSDTLRLYSYKRFADVDLTGSPANAFFTNLSANEVLAIDPDIDPATGVGQNGFSRLFRMRSAAFKSPGQLARDTTFNGGPYHTPVGNLLEEQHSPLPIFTEDPLFAWQPYASPGATRRTLGLGEGGHLLVFGDSPDDFEDDRVAIYSHRFPSGASYLTGPSSKTGSVKILTFQYAVE